MNVLEPPPECVEHKGSGIGLLTIPVQVYMNAAGDWEVDQNPIVLDNPNVEVQWDLSRVIIHYGGLTVVKNVEIEFPYGPTGYDTTTGPFDTIADLSSKLPLQVLCGEKQKPPYRDCYRYNLVVNFGVDVIRLFRKDPQIDNLAPPGDGDGHGGEP